MHLWEKRHQCRTQLWTTPCPAPRNQSYRCEGSGLGYVFTSSPMLAAAQESMAVNTGTTWDIGCGRSERSTVILRCPWLLAGDRETEMGRDRGCCSRPHEEREARSQRSHAHTLTMNTWVIHEHSLSMLDAQTLKTTIMSIDRGRVRTATKRTWTERHL